MHRGVWLAFGLLVGFVGAWYGAQWALASRPVPAEAALPATPISPIVPVSAQPAAPGPTAAATPAAAQPMPPADRLPPSGAELRLLGTVLGAPQDEVALIAHAATGAQNIYAVGDAILAGVTLARIESDRVVLRRGDQWEVLLLTSTADRDAPPPRHTRAPAPTQAANALYRVHNDMRHLGPAPDAHGTRPRKTARDEQHTLVPATFQRQYGMTLATAVLSAGVQPRQVNGEPAGLQLRDLGSRGVLGVLGFREGDVLLSATGIPLDQPNDLSILAEDFENGLQMWVRIERRGTPYYLLFDFT